MPFFSAHPWKSRVSCCAGTPSCRPIDRRSAQPCQRSCAFAGPLIIFFSHSPCVCMERLTGLHAGVKQAGSLEFQTRAGVHARGPASNRSRRARRRGALPRPAPPPGWSLHGAALPPASGPVGARASGAGGGRQKRSQVPQAPASHRGAGAQRRRRRQPGAEVRSRDRSLWCFSVSKFGGMLPLPVVRVWLRQVLSNAEIRKYGSATATGAANFLFIRVGKAIRVGWAIRRHMNSASKAMF